MSATWQNSTKAGSAWQYDDPKIKYDGTNDYGLPIYYEFLGTPTTWDNQDES